VIFVFTEHTMKQSRRASSWKCGICAADTRSLADAAAGDVIAPFLARVYSEEAMAAGKVNALLNDRRSVPRDVYDLADLIRRGASPVALWSEQLSRENLERKRSAVLPKVTSIDFPLANAELLPYLARDIRSSIDENRWGDLQIEVVEGVGRWFDEAILKARAAKDINRDPDTDYDLAGR
jgi:hypothetical protein